MKRYKTLFAFIALSVAFIRPALGTLFTSDTAIAPGNTTYDGQDIVVIGCTVTIDGPHTFSDVVIIEDGTITHSPATNNLDVGLDLTVSNNIVIEAGSAIDVNGLGYGPGAGPGAGVSASADTFGLDFSSGGGGAYGGNGGASLSGVSGGGSYGSLETSTDAGSGGGAGFGLGGAGGGIVNLTIGGALVLDGQITAGGGIGFSPASGGGSGGGIWISAPSASGLGAISANGGAGEPSAGGGGSGGRIALFFTTNDFTGAVTAQSGAGALAGGAGTIDFGSPGDLHDVILIDNGGLSGTNTPLSLPTGSSLTISGGAISYFSNGAETLSSLVIASNSWLTAPPASPQCQLIIQENATLQAGGGVNLDGVAPPGGIGAGGSYSTNDTYFGGGGGHGGVGGSALGAAGGTNYDSVALPVDTGSSGGKGAGESPFNDGGAGGGAMTLLVSGTLTLNGSITADGNPGASEGSGGGSGGSVSLNAATLAGSGLISANGGASLLATGGGGGGGRIALHANINQFVGALSAHAGSGLRNGGAGTIYVQSGNSFPLLLIDNGGRQGAETPFSETGLEATLDFVVTNGSVAAFEIGSPEFFAHTVMVASNSSILGPIGTLSLNVTSNVTVQAGGGIIMDGQGIGQSDGYIGSGGGYGGEGGNSIHGPGGPSYGELMVIGGGYAGGNGTTETRGGAGGGFLEISTQQGTLTLNGFISANGEPATPGSGAGGGSGGGISIVVRSVNGSGIIMANGGAGDGNVGGGGGGGRIYVSATSNSFNGQFAAHGGPGFVAGGAGTIYLQPDTANTQVILDNGGLIGTNTPIIDLPECSLVVSNGAIAAVGGFSLDLESLFIGSNSFIVSTQSSSIEFVVQSNAVIQPGGGLIAGGGEGDEGFTTTSNSITTGGGGGNGGDGGNSAFGAQGGAANYAVSVTVPETGGGAGGDSGGVGGGALQLHVTGSLVLGGMVSANGNPGVVAGSGGGAGGSISLTASNLSGSGVISANGGAGQLPYGGGGGGGVVNVSTTSANQFPGVITAYGGNGGMAGGAGLVLEQFGASVPQVIIDNGGLSGTNTPFSGVSLSSDYDVSILHGAIVSISDNPSEMLNLLVGSNSFLVSTSLDLVNLTFLGNVTIQPTGGVILDALGDPAGKGIGVGLSIQGTLGGGGGGYGGFGGSAQGGAQGGEVYGTPTEPASFGSGGAVASSSFGLGGGQGGGALEMRITGTLLVQGRISANGANGLTTGGGGGSGGSVWLTVGTLAGNGAITANGGSGQLPSGGGGGGGRIGIAAPTNQFIGLLTAFGGPGFVPGGPGSVYISSQGDTPPQLVIDAGGMPGAYTALPSQLEDNVSVIVRGGSRALLPNTTQISLFNLLVGSNSFVLQTNFLPISMSVSSNVTVQAGGGIVFDAAGNGPTGLGAGGSTDSTADSRTGAGGGYGGMGGIGESGAPGGGTYGLVQFPEALGSGGGVGLLPNAVSARGGGAFTLSVQRTLEIDGAISARGAAASSEASGGGSGGSLQLTAKVLSGAGTISVNGGPGDLPNGGGGGGGRIALNSPSNLFTGTISAYGGAGFVPGGAGTLFLTPEGLGIQPILGDAAAAADILIVDNGGVSGAATPLGGLEDAIPYNVILSGHARVVPTNDWVISALLVESNAVINQMTNSVVNIMVTANALVQSNASISADGQGWDADSGPGAGVTATNYTSSGGGNGGMGGPSEGGAPGGATNGFAPMPTGWGSGGGLYFGEVPNLSQGGGAVKLTVSGTLTINGTVSADGNSAIFPGAGGGAGGGVWLIAETLAGAGSITANGGAGQDNLGGGGGGGRIAVYAASNEFTGTMTALGGAGFAPGGNGTLFYSTNNMLPTLPVMPGAPTPLLVTQPPSTSLLILTWTGVGGASYQVQFSTNLVNWQPCGGVISGNDGAMNLSLPMGAEPQGYFRLAPPD
jgi:hypothetical protein